MKQAAGTRPVGLNAVSYQSTDSSLSEYFEDSTCCLLHADFLHGVLLNLKMESTCSSETSVDFKRTTWPYIPEDRTLHLGFRSDKNFISSTTGYNNKDAYLKFVAFYCLKDVKTVR
jgi:hypothetical protein